MWGLIIFAFDRFIVSTHRKCDDNKLELKNIFFYVRFIFAISLGILISHPFILLYFDGSIIQKIRIDNTLNFSKISDTLSVKLNTLEKRKISLEKLLTAEQSGQKVVLDVGYSSGIPGNKTRTKEIKKLIASNDTTIVNERNRINPALSSINTTKDNASFDYLKREVALEMLKEKNPIINITQWVLMISVILVDILPVTFKTFAPFGLYDKILSDNITFLKELDTSKRKAAVQSLYDTISVMPLQKDDKANNKSSPVKNEDSYYPKFKRFWEKVKNSLDDIIFSAMALAVEGFAYYFFTHNFSFAAVIGLPIFLVNFFINNLLKKYSDLSSAQLEIK